jgi:type VII secretion integral membrane protein EccD
VATTGTDLVRVTVQTPDRRVDVALPERVPVATLLPALLAAGGEELADRGALHAGWVLRRVSGGAFDTGQGLVDQGVRDGDVLCLGFADENWPELDYDDAVEAIAVGAGRRGRRWDARASRVASIVAAVALFAGALVAVGSAGPPWTLVSVSALLFGALLVAASVVAARAYRDLRVGTLLGALALPYALLGGVLAGGSFGPGGRSPMHALAHMPGQIAIGALVVIVFAIAAAVGVGRVRPIFVAAIVAGFAGIVDSVVALSTTPVRAASVTLGIVVLFAGLAPAIAARMGGLPRPPAVGGQSMGTPPARSQPVLDRGQVPPRSTPAEPGTGSGAVDTDLLFAAVSRTDDMLTGLLVGVAIATAAAAAVIAIDGGWAGRLLLLAVAGAMALRARMYAAVRHRTAALVTAGLAAAPLIAVGSFVGSAALLVAAVFGIIGLITIGLGAGERAGGPVSPYLGRLADLAEIVSLAAIVPLVCVVLGLYSRLRGLHL